jgi:hypothetical protein
LKPLQQAPRVAVMRRGSGVHDVTGGVRFQCACSPAPLPWPHGMMDSEVVRCDVLHVAARLGVRCGGGRTELPQQQCMPPGRNDTHAPPTLCYPCCDSHSKVSRFARVASRRRRPVAAQVSYAGNTWGLTGQARPMQGLCTQSSIEEFNVPALLPVHDVPGQQTGGREMGYRLLHLRDGSLLLCNVSRVSRERTAGLCGLSPCRVL